MAGTGISTTAGQHSFAEVPSASIPRSVFNRSFGHKTTINAGKLYPIFADEILPGDTMSMNVQMFGRLATLISPLMDNIFLDVHFFFCPNRILWTQWVNFMGEQESPDDSTTYEVPTVPAPSGQWLTGSLGDHFGIPVGKAISVINLPFRAYNLIFNEWYRPQDAVDKAPFDARSNGPDLAGNYIIRDRYKRHDYFTSALPWPQKGPAVTLPLGETAPVIPAGSQTGGSGSLDDRTPEFAAHGGGSALRLSVTNGNAAVLYSPVPNNAGDAMWASQTGLITDLSSATAAQINDIRMAFQVQRLYERDARSGSRYAETLRSHFGVVSPDGRLQRPEFLGGGTVRVNVNSVPQTGATLQSTTPQGNLSAYGTFNKGGIRFAKSFTEHGWVIGIVSARADLNYQQGVERIWSRRTRLDYFWPALQGLGEQAIYRREIMLQANAADDEVFGYNGRYDEYRYKPSIISGQFRTTKTSGGDYGHWHLAQEFSDGPKLDAEFLKENPPMNRVIAVENEQQFLIDAHFSYRCARPMPTFGVPGMVDHF